MFSDLTLSAWLHETKQISKLPKMSEFFAFSVDFYLYVSVVVIISSDYPAFRAEPWRVVVEDRCWAGGAG